MINLDPFSQEIDEEEAQFAATEEAEQAESTWEILADLGDLVRSGSAQNMGH